MSRLPGHLKNKYVSLKDGVFLKELEEFSLYSAIQDELFAINQEAFNYLRKCNGNLTIKEHPPEKEFLEFCLANNILKLSDSLENKQIYIGHNENPSLRYLLINITSRCNIKCKHCYLGEAKPIDLPYETIARIFSEFAEIGGLRLIISGGEPLLHPDFWKINQLISNLPFRTILISNGTLIRQEDARRLNFDEVQISLDGYQESHDYIRGEGNYNRARRGIENLLQNNKQVSIATMLHSQNLKDMPILEEICNQPNIISWTIDIPTKEGRLAENPDILPTLSDAVPLLEYQFGAEVHESSADYICGAHLACIQSIGTLTKCGFYQDWTAGKINKGLRNCWIDLPKMKYQELSCDCQYLEDCRGGCRYRAEVSSDRSGPDPVKCRDFNVEFKLQERYIKTKGVNTSENQKSFQEDLPCL